MWLGRNLVYHYTSLYTFLEYILPTLKLRLGLLSDMNDSRDAKHWGLIIRSTDRNGEHRRTILRDTYHDLTLKKVRVLSTCLDGSVAVDPSGEHQFGKHVSGRGFAIASMWAHYGEKNRGVCLALDPEVLKDEIRYCASDDAMVMCKKITYSDFPMGLHNALYLKDPGNDSVLYDFVLKHVELNSDFLFFSKNIAWEQEREFRFLAIENSRDEELLVSIDKALVGLVVSEQFPAVYAKTVRSYLGGKVDIWILQWDNGIPCISLKLR